MNKKSIYIVALVIVGLMVIGQVMIYGINPYNTQVNSWSVNEDIKYEITSNTSLRYNALLIDTGMSIPDELIIYDDPDHVPYTSYTEPYMRNITNLTCSELSIRNVSHETMDAEKLKIKMEEDIGFGKASSRLLVLTGILPDTIYQGDSEDIIFKWLEIGGVLYWTGGGLGHSISSSSGIERAGDGYGANFLGIPDEDIKTDNRRIHGIVKDKATDYDIGKGLSVMYNESTFGINTRNLTDYISIGFTSEGYDSLVLTKFHGGDGMIVMFGGKLLSGWISPISQVIASKLTYNSSISDHNSGDLFHSTEKGEMKINSSRLYVLYIYVGSPEIYARTFNY